MGKRTIAGVTFESEWYDAVKEPMSEPMYSEQDMEAKDREIERLRAELADYKAFVSGYREDIAKFIRDAADDFTTIDSLKATNKQLREGLRVFADPCKWVADHDAYGVYMKGGAHIWAGDDIDEPWEYAAALLKEGEE